MATRQRPPAQKVLLFDWWEGGHHEEYLAYATRALRDRHDVVIAAPESARGRLPDEAAFVSLRPSRPDVAETDLAEILKAERASLLGAIRSSGATAALHMFA